MARKPSRAGKKPTGIWTNDEIKEKARKIGQSINGTPNASSGFNYSVITIYNQLFNK